MNRLVHIAVVDDQSLFRQALTNLLTQLEGFLPPLSFSGGPALLDHLRKGKEPVPGIVLLDLEMPDMSGIQVNEQLQRDFPAIKVIVLTVHNSAHLIASLIRSGADGFLTKNCDRTDLETCIRMVHEQGFYIDKLTMKALQLFSPSKPNTLYQVNGIPLSLSKREVEILQLICMEYSSPEIAARLFISMRTVEGHRTNLLQKTGCRNIAGLVLFAVRNRLHPHYV
jgi:DNA-binding NarL/FixJ family response regulator